MEIYVVTAYRWGDRNNHSYVLGAFNKITKAVKCADSHAQYRGGKYACVVDEVVLNSFNDDSDEYSKEVYRAKSYKD
jgi:hypothetical protein